MQQYRRKVVKHGPSTLTLSLPTSWVQKHGIKKGTELLITPQHGLLSITTLNPSEGKKTELDLRGK